MFDNYVVCAAIRTFGITIRGMYHWDKNMEFLVERLKTCDKFKELTQPPMREEWELGFMSLTGKFLTSEEAKILSEENDLTTGYYRYMINSLLEGVV